MSELSISKTVLQGKISPSEILREVPTPLPRQSDQFRVDQRKLLIPVYEQEIERLIHVYEKAEVIRLSEIALLSRVYRSQLGWIAATRSSARSLQTRAVRLGRRQVLGEVGSSFRTAKSDFENERWLFVRRLLTVNGDILHTKAIYDELTELFERYIKILNKHIDQMNTVCDELRGELSNAIAELGEVNVGSRLLRQAGTWTQQRILHGSLVHKLAILVRKGPTLIKLANYLIRRHRSQRGQ